TFQLSSLSAVQAATGSLTLAVRGYHSVPVGRGDFYTTAPVAHCLRFDGVQVSTHAARAMAESAGPITRYEEGTLEGCSLTPASGGTGVQLLRSEASAVTLRSDGAALWAQRNGTPESHYDLTGLSGGIGMAIGAFHLGGSDMLLISGANLANDLSGEGFGFMLQTAAYATAGGGSWPILRAVSFGMIPRNVPDAATWILPVSATLGAEPVPIWEVGRDGLLMRATLSESGTDDATPIFHVDGDLSVRFSTTGRETWITHSTGEIARLVTTQGGERMDLYGRMALGPDAQLVGAVRALDDTHAIALVRDLTTARDSIAGGPDFTGRARFYLVDLGSPVPQAPIPSLGVSSVPSGADAFVCWGATSAPLVREGWTLGGRPALVRPAGGQAPCALVIRDPGADAASVSAVDAFHVRGPVPGVGLMSISASPTTQPAFGVVHRDAVAFEGGFVWNATAWTRTGFPLRDGSDSPTGGVTDLHGGLWMTDAGPTVRHAAMTERRFALDLSMRPGGSAAITGRVVSGGILYRVQLPADGPRGGVFYRMTLDGV
ncbi:MAG: hypothetical protein WCJ30_26950, partial [Deltaproteobacteria bacterium]